MRFQNFFESIHDYAMSPVNFFPHESDHNIHSWRKKKRMFENACKLLRNAGTLSLEGFLHNSSIRGGNFGVSKLLCL